MKIIALNGSPKGELSITLQYLKFINKNFPEHDFKIINISKDINKIEKSDKYYNSIIDNIKSSDGIIWFTPIYTLLVPSQLKRFIELIFEHNSEAAFNGKYTTTLTTSVRFFDHCAHNYLNAICDDLNMNYIEGFSAKKDELLEWEIRNNLINFAGNFFNSIENKLPAEIRYFPLSSDIPEYIPNDIIDISKSDNSTLLS